MKEIPKSFWRTASFLLLGALIFSPAAFVFANDSGDADSGTSSDCPGLEIRERMMKRVFGPGGFGEIVEVDTQENTILLKLMHPPFGVDEEEEKYALVHYEDDIVLMKNHEEVGEGELIVGKYIHVAGKRIGSEEYQFEVTAEHVGIFDELKPWRDGLGHRKHMKRKQDNQV